jgi:hypothetical protein
MPSVRVLPLLVLSASLARCGMCEPNSGPGPSASGSASAMAPEAGPSASPGASVHRPPRPKPHLLCRLIEGVGDARLENGSEAGVPLLVQGPVMSGWIDLPAGGRFVAKDAQTTRETTFRGPGRVKACVLLEEESWIASGGFDSTVGAGESPGAEEWVVTPLGVVRYAAARLSVDVGARDAHVAVASGGAFLWTPSDAVARGGAGPAGHPAGTEDGWLRADPGAFVLASTPSAPPPLSLEGARAAVTACATLGQSAHDLTSQLMAGGADAGTVMAQVSTRRLARAACAVAGLRLGALPATPTLAAQLAPLSAQLAAGSAGWNSVPEAPASPP